MQPHECFTPPVVNFAAGNGAVAGSVHALGPAAHGAAEQIQASAVSRADGHHGASDRFRDFGDNGIADTADKRASFSGVMPINHAQTASKTSRPTVPRAPFCNCSESGREFRACVSSLALPERQSRAVGVASIPARLPPHGPFAVLRSGPPLDARGVEISSNDPDAVASMRRAGVPSTHHERPAGVADRFQRSEYPVRASSSDCRHVLKACPSRSDFIDKPEGLEEQPGSISANT
jgi:hypothetical protein